MFDFKNSYLVLTVNEIVWVVHHFVLNEFWNTGRSLKSLRNSSFWSLNRLALIMFKLSFWVFWVFFFLMFSCFSPPKWGKQGNLSIHFLRICKRLHFSLPPEPSQDKQLFHRKMKGTCRWQSILFALTLTHFRLEKVIYLIEYLSVVPWKHKVAQRCSICNEKSLHGPSFCCLCER